jgi:hypothetical protein
VIQTGIRSLEMILVWFVVPTTCSQIAVITRVKAAELHDRLPVSHRGVPLVTVLNGTLMARDLGRVPAYLTVRYP